MGTINIYPPIEVFDHEKYCNDERDGCSWVQNEYSDNCGHYIVCLKFHDKHEELEELHKTHIFIEKCGQCKKYYKIATFSSNSQTIGGAVIHKDGTVELTEEEYLKKGLASADNFIDKMEKVAPSVLGDEDQ